MNVVQINEELCSKLIALGIPLERQDPSSLSALFPPAFKVANFDLSKNDIAKVLIAFVEKGIISFSSLSDETAVHRTTGKHVCHFYRNEEEVIKMTAAFLEEGLRSGERCLWTIPAWLDVTRAREASRAIRSSLADAEASGRIIFLTEAEVYLDSTGIIRSADEIIKFWLEEEQKASTACFTGIRITGDGTGLVSNDNWASGVEYERLADEAFRGRSITALCTYSLATSSPERLAEVLGQHNCGLFHRSGAWDEIHPGAGVATAIEFLQHTQH